MRTSLSRLSSCRLLLLVVPIALVAPGVARGAPRPGRSSFVESGSHVRADDTGPHRSSLQRLVHVRNARVRATTPAAASADVGDVAVMVSNDSIVVPPRAENRFDLPTPSSLSFVPGPSGADELSVAFSAAGFDPVLGPEVVFSGTGDAPGDDDTVEVELPFSFPFLGALYDSVWVNSDGNVTLGVGDGSSGPRDAARLIGGPPRIAPLLTDLDPSNTGTVHADPRADRVVITWNGVTNWVPTPPPGFPGFPTTPNTFQAVLHSDGGIDFAYDTVFDPVSSLSHGGVIGIAAGGDGEPFNEIDLTADLPDSFAVGAVFEEFHAAAPGAFDIVALAQEFYRTHEDRYDFLVVFHDFLLPGVGGFAFNLLLKNETRGLGGTQIFDFDFLVGPEVAELESLVYMNRIGLYWPDAPKLVDPPLRMFQYGCANPGGEFTPCGAEHDQAGTGDGVVFLRERWFGTSQGDFGFSGAFTLGLDSAMSLMAQEVGHRWLAGAAFVDPVTGCGPLDQGPECFPFESFDLLGRDLFHWSFFFNVRVPDSQFGGDPRASGMEGNAIRDLGPEASLGFPFPCTRPGESTFLTEPDELVDGYTELDQYLMGLRTADEVSPFWYVNEPRSLRFGTPLDFLSADPAMDDVDFCGKRVDLTVDDIRATPFQEIDPTQPFLPPFNGGPRVPELGDEVDSPCGEDRKTMAFILLVEKGPPRSPAHAAAIRQVDTLRRTWERYGNGPATAGRGKFDTGLNPECF